MLITKLNIKGGFCVKLLNLNISNFNFPVLLIWSLEEFAYHIAGECNDKMTEKAVILIL